MTLPSLPRLLWYLPPIEDKVLTKWKSAVKLGFPSTYYLPLQAPCPDRLRPSIHLPHHLIRCKNRHPCQKMQPVSFTSIFPLQSSSYSTASYPGKLSLFPCRSHFKQFVPFDWVYNIIVSTLLSLELIRHRNPHWRHIPVISISTTIQFQHGIDLCNSYKEEYHITYFMVSLVLF